MAAPGKRKILADFLERLHTADKEIRAEILRSIEELLPEEPNPAELRGPSWNVVVAGIPPSGAVAKTGGRAPRAFDGTIVVVDEGGAPVAGASLVVTVAATGVVRARGTTSEAGAFALRLLPEDHVVTAEKGELAGSAGFAVPRQDGWRVEVLVRAAAAGGGGRGVPPARLSPPAEAAAAPAALAVGDRVIAWGSMAGAVAGLPDAPGGLYEVVLDNGARVMVPAGLLARGAGGGGRSPAPERI